MSEPADAGERGLASRPEATRHRVQDDADPRPRAPLVLDRAVDLPPAPTATPAATPAAAPTATLAAAPTATPAAAPTAATADLLVALEPAPALHELPRRFPSPFDSRRAHPLAARAADQLMAELATAFPGGVPAAGERDERLEGKMFAVLVVQAPNGGIGALRGFSGMLGGRWEAAGFVPPMFEVAAREPWWGEAQAQLRRWDEELRQLEAGRDAVALRAEWAALQRQQAAEAEELRQRHRERRAARHRTRQALRAAEPSPALAARQSPARDRPSVAAEPAPSPATAEHALDQESRGDGAERRRLDAAQRSARLPLQARLAELEERHAALSRLRAESSARFQRQLHDLYAVPSWRGDARPLRDLFAPGEPPSGAGDCAGPKLLAHALRAGLRPLALAELWWGPSPLGGGRHHGQLYPACRGKCGPLLPHLLRGLDVEDAPLFGGGAPEPDEDDAGDERVHSHSVAPYPDSPHRGMKTSPRSLNDPASHLPDLEIVHEDEWLVALTKPCGLLSVPGRSAALADSVLARLRRLLPGATGPLLVHRLDLDTSGLLLAAKDRATHAALQRQFARREIEKRYVALLDGELSAARGDRGTIELALRTDLDDRPRQIHDPLHGKPAITHWQVLQRSSATTRVALFPRTGRTHQLRVHAAHPLGLAASILGDRLYGRPSDSPRLMLHAERLAFIHPGTGVRLELVGEVPF